MDNFEVPETPGLTVYIWTTGETYGTCSVHIGQRQDLNTNPTSVLPSAPPCFPSAAIL